MILGLMEPSTVVVSSLDYFDLDAVREVDRDENGNYRWPFGLELAPPGVSPSPEPR